jgi:hypothetical protein
MWGRRGGGVCPWHGQMSNPRSTGSHRPHGFARRTAINLWGGMNELTDRTICSVDAVTGAEIGPYRKFRLIKGASWIRGLPRRKEGGFQ